MRRSKKDTPISEPLQGDEVAELLQALACDEKTALVRFFARRLNDTTEAEDMAQEVYLRLAKAGNIAEVQDPKAFMYTTAVNLLRDRSRRRNTRHVDAHVSMEGDTLACESPTQERILQGQDELRLLVDAIDQLPPKCRQVFMLNRFEEMSYKDIARRLNISIRTVEKHISRALEHCRLILDAAESGGRE